MSVLTHLGYQHLEVRASNSTQYTNDNTFGPFVDIPGRDSFDFTLLFEETILSIIPSALLLLLIPLRIIRLWKSPRKVTGSYLQTAKIVNIPSCINLYFKRLLLTNKGSSGRV